MFGRPGPTGALRRLSLLITLGTLWGCGVVYVTPGVSEGRVAGADVTVIPLTAR